MYNHILNETKTAITELIEKSAIPSFGILVVGCSTSEIIGKKIGTSSSEEIASLVMQGIIKSLNLLDTKKIFLAIQCCEHLNRALVIEKEAAIYHHYPCVNVKPIPKAGGALAAEAFQVFKSPAVVESIQADAGIDIGNTLIGMHLKPVAVPLRLSQKTIGHAYINAAKTRLKYIGGKRAEYI